MKQHIHFVNNASDTALASTRMRIKKPVELLSKAGYKVTEADTIDAAADVVVFHKHHLPVYEQQMLNMLNTLGVTTVFDVSDYHMNHPQLKEHYKYMITNASRVLVNGPTLLAETQKHTDKPCFLVKDPITFPEYKPNVKPGEIPRLMWFGHKTNINPLMMLLEDIQEYPITVITNTPMESTREGVKALMWEEGLVEREIYNSDIVMLPLKDDVTKQFKNTNRAVDSLMAGKFVATDSQNYKELENFIWIGDIKSGIEWYRNNPEKAKQMILNGQDYVKEVYSDQRMLESLEVGLGLKDSKKEAINNEYVG